MANVIKFEEKLIAKLPPAEMAGRLMALPVHARLEMLINRPDAEEVVAALTEQDFYIFVKDLGNESAGPLLSLARLEQLNHVLDLECWHRDQVLPGKTLAWLETIVVASNQKFLEWLYKVDFELLIILFKKWLDLELLPDDTEYSEAQDWLPSETIDDQYYFDVKYPQYKGLLISILSFLFETHNEFYRELMQHVLMSLNSEIEELAYRFHRGRLEDSAIPDFVEAQSIYRPLGPVGVRRNKTCLYAAADDREAPVFALMMISPRHNLLQESIAAIDDTGVKKTLQLELASIANKIVIADDLGSENAESIRQAAERAAAYVNLGLEAESKGELNLAIPIIEHAYLEDLYRLAGGLIKSVTDRSDGLVLRGWMAGWPHGFNILDQPWLEKASLLQAKPPMVLRTVQATAQQPEEDWFRTLADIEQARETLAMLEDIGQIFDQCLRNYPQWDDLDYLLWRKGQLHNLELVTLGSLLLTSAAHQLWRGNWGGSPLPVKDWPDIMPHIAPLRIRKAVTDHIEERVSSRTASQRALRYIEPFLQNYTEEMTPNEGGGLAEPSLVPYFLFTDENEMGQKI